MLLTCSISVARQAILFAKMSSCCCIAASREELFCSAAAARRVCSLAVCSHSAARCSAFARVTRSDASATTRDVQLAFLYCNCSCSCWQCCASALASCAAAAATFSACQTHALHQWDNSDNTLPSCVMLNISRCGTCRHAVSSSCKAL